MQSHPSSTKGKQDRPYRNLLVMAILSFIAMYGLMYAMVDSPANVFHSMNQVYMAGLMTAPMVVIEILWMGAMYKNKKANAGLVLGAVALGVACFTAIRNQTAISDRQFLRSMIPHHAGALLMCREASIKGPEVKELCRTIIAGQQAEIDQMKAMLGALKE
jgi:uncharacterized protein (DUF305 family)